MILIKSNKTARVHTLFRLVKVFQDISGLRHLPHESWHLTYTILIKAPPWALLSAVSLSLTHSHTNTHQHTIFTRGNCCDCGVYKTWSRVWSSAKTTDQRLLFPQGTMQPIKCQRTEMLRDAPGLKSNLNLAWFTSAMCVLWRREQKGATHNGAKTVKSWIHTDMVETLKDPKMTKNCLCLQKYPQQQPKHIILALRSYTVDLRQQTFLHD